jgi:O-Antigen ligase
MMTLVEFRNNLLLIVVGLYLVLNDGFMQLRIPPTAGSGIPIGELVLLFSILTIHYDILVQRISSIIYLLPFLIWWSIGLIHIVIAVPKYGFWAFRDASHVIESLFLVIAFTFAERQQMLDKFFNWLKKILLIVCIYTLSYPFSESLKPLSPKLISGAGYEIPLLFNYGDISSAVLIVASFYLICSSSHVITFFVAIFLLGFATFLFQARTIYLQIIVVSLLVLVYRRRSFLRVIIVITVLVGFLATMPMVGLHFKGRLREVSLDFLINHFLAIGGVENEGVEGAARGVPQRLGWWSDLYERWTSDARTFLFGLGYGFPLINFRQHEGITVREPHNSYISIMARLGLLGSLAFIWMHTLLLRVWYRTYRAYRRMGWQEGENQLLILLMFFILIWISAIGQDAFEKPFCTVPYYFFWGIVLRMNWHLDNNPLYSKLRFVTTKSKEEL